MVCHTKKDTSHLVEYLLIKSIEFIRKLYIHESWHASLGVSLVLIKILIINTLVTIVHCKLTQQIRCFLQLSLIKKGTKTLNNVYPVIESGIIKVNILAV